ncbi:MAG: hypothetical protein LQ340_001853 [Diploschistes diacapsis]|nr:MAG: hypothetical protein LQ340_001853 [Diploschistes diacapsis]
MSGNQALNINYGIGGTPDLGITTHGSDWYWAVTSVMGAATLVFMGLSFTRPRTERLFYYITASVTLVATIAYYSMGSNLGQVPIGVEFPRGTTGPANNAGSSGAGGTREIFYARYIDWVITTPLLLLDLLLTSGMPWPTILVTMLVDEVMVVTGLLGALTRTTYKWGYWTIGMVALFYIVYVVVGPGRKYASAINTDVQRSYNITGPMLMFLWLLYPIAWGLAEGGNVIHPDSEAVFYGVLDILAKPIWGAILIWGHRNIHPATLGLRIHDVGELRSIETEKHAHNNGGLHNGNNSTPAV